MATADDGQRAQPKKMTSNVKSRPGSCPHAASSHPRAQEQTRPCFFQIHFALADALFTLRGMKRRGFLPSIILACCVVFAGCATSGGGKQRTMLPGAKRVLFLGDSITHSGQYVDAVDAYFFTRFPGRRIEFLNLGLPSETVSGLSEPGHADGKFPRPDLHERLERVLAKTRPDVVIACYGMNDGIYLPFADERFARFTNGLMRLRERVAVAGAKLIHVTPPIFDEAKGKGPGYGETLDRYADWMVAQRAANWNVVDVHGPMHRYLAQRRQTDTNFALAGDGVHPGETGHWIIAQQILRHLGARDVSHAESATAMVRVHLHGEQILKLVQQRQRILKDAWLTATGHERPGMNKGLPLTEAEQRAHDLEEQVRKLATDPASK